MVSNPPYECRWKDAICWYKQRSHSQGQTLKWSASGSSLRHVSAISPRHLCSVPPTAKMATMGNPDSLFISPTGQTLKTEIAFISHTRLLFREGDSFRLWPESIPFCEEFPNEDRAWWAILRLQVAKDRCPVGSCHTSHPHTVLSLAVWDNTTTPCHALVFSIKKPLRASV